MDNKVSLKVCSYRSPQRYVMLRTVEAALASIRKIHPDFEVDIYEIRDVQEILKITPVLILPSLVINDRLVCTGRFPKTGEVIQWLLDSREESDKR